MTTVFRIWKEFISMMNLLVKDRDWQKLTVPNWLKSMTKFSKSSIVLIHARTKSWRSNSNSNCLSEVPLPSSYFNKSVPSKKCSPSSKKKENDSLFLQFVQCCFKLFWLWSFFLSYNIPENEKHRNMISTVVSVTSRAKTIPRNTC